MVERVDGAYFQQGFREGNGSPKPYGKLRKVKNIDKIDQKTGYDINNDGLIAKENSEDFANVDSDFNQDDRSPLFRINQSQINNTFVVTLA